MAERHLHSDLGMALNSTGRSDTARGAREWLPVLHLYREPDGFRSGLELAVTLVPFVLLWVAAWASLRWSYLISLAFATLAAGFLVRLFMIQHDCGHGALFARRLTNDWIGRVISVLTLTPYDAWRHSHGIHHASSGNLDRRGIGDITTLTVAEYLERPWWGRLAYRLYRSPAVMFGLGPAFVFLLRNRWPLDGTLARWRSWVSPMATNFAIVLAAAAVASLVGMRAFLLVHIPIVLIAATIGVWLFYIQHQFEHTTWASDQAWNLHDAALYGSSYYDLPAFLRWFTADIGVHHVHHLCSRIPFYRLPQALRAHPDIARIGRITLRESLRCVRLTLWDETNRRLISFQELRTRAGSERRADLPCNNGN